MARSRYLRSISRWGSLTLGLEIDGVIRRMPRVLRLEGAPEQGAQVAQQGKAGVVVRVTVIGLVPGDDAVDVVAGWRVDQHRLGAAGIDESLLGGRLDPGRNLGQPF